MEKARSEKAQFEKAQFAKAQFAKANWVAKEFPSILGVLDRVRLASRQVSKDVTLWPLVLAGPADRGDDAEVWPLDEALEDGFVGVSTTDTSGLVEVESRAPVPVWVPAGEWLGGVGLAAESRILRPRERTVVRLRGGEPPCARCCQALAAAFHGADAPVGFVAAVHDRAVGLELVLPSGLLARRLPARLEAWAPWLLALEEAGQPAGFESPEALLGAVRAGRHLGGRARAEVVSGPVGMALTL